MTQRRDVQGPVSRFMAIMAIAVAVLSSPSCDLFDSGNPFGPEYSTSNFIASLGFAVFTGSNPGPTDPANPDQASWDLKYRYGDWDDYDYVTLAPVADVGYETAGGASYAEPLPAGLSAAAPVYRLELVNLVQDGSFEVDEGGASIVTGTATRGITAISPLKGLQSYRLESGGGSITWTPDLVGGFPATAGRDYRVEFRYPVGGSPAEMRVLIASDASPYAPDNSSGRFGASFLPAVDGETFDLTFSGPPAGTGFSPVNIDDVTLCSRSGAIVRLLLGRNDTDPALESGVYSFSVWARVDPLSSETQPPYHLDRFAVSMSPTPASTLAGSSGLYQYSASSPGWRKITAVLSGNVLQYTYSISEPNVALLSLDIDLQGSRPGRVLLAAPELRFYPNGI